MKELEEMIATRDAETDKVAKAAAVREEQFVDRASFLAQNVRGKYSLCFLCNSVLHCSILLYLYFLFMRFTAEAAGVPAPADPSGDKMSLE